MKKLFLIVIAIVLAAASASAQKDSSGFYVQSFKKLDWDLDARSNFPILDQNNRKAALIKVVIPATGFDFDVGVMGVVDVKQEVGEIWVYVPEGVRKITIRHRDYGIIRDYEFGCPIESASVYELTLHIPRRPASTVIVKDSIIYVPAPAEPVAAKKKEPVGLSVLATASVPDPSFGAMVAWNRKRFGTYVKFTGNFTSSGHSYSCNGDSTTDGGFVWTTGESRVSRLSVTAGGMYRCLGWMSVSAGVGYGKRVLTWEDSKGDWAKVSDHSSQGVAADLGLLLRFGHLTTYLGATTISFKRIYPELGIGFVF